MIVRQTLNFAVHLAGGLLVGALAVAAVHALTRRADDRPPAHEARDASGDAAYEV